MRTSQACANRTAVLPPEQLEITACQPGEQTRAAAAAEGAVNTVAWSPGSNTNPSASEIPEQMWAGSSAGPASEPETLASTQSATAFAACRTSTTLVSTPRRRTLPQQPRALPSGPVLRSTRRGSPARVTARPTTENEAPCSVRRRRTTRSGSKPVVGQCTPKKDIRCCLLWGQQRAKKPLAAGSRCVGPCHDI